MAINGKILRLDNKLNNLYDYKELNIIETMLDDIKKIVSTRKGSYPGDPKFGVDILKFQFEPTNSSMMSELKRELEVSINTYKSLDMNIEVEVFHESAYNKKGVVARIIGTSKDIRLEADLFLSDDFRSLIFVYEEEVLQSMELKYDEYHTE